MSYAKKEKDSAVGNMPPAVSVNKERIALFMQNWKIVESYSPIAVHKHVTSFCAGQVIFDEKKIDSLLAQGAPIRVYSRDAD